MVDRILADADIDIILLAGRYTLMDRTAEAGLLDLCARRQVDIVDGGVFNSGLLATGPVPGAQFDYALATESHLSLAGRLHARCAEAGVGLATAALQFPRRSPVVASTLVGTGRRASLERNLAAWGAPVPHHLWTELDAIVRGA